MRLRLKRVDRHLRYDRLLLLNLLRLRGLLHGEHRNLLLRLLLHGGLRLLHLRLLLRRRLLLRWNGLLQLLSRMSVG